MKLDVNGGDVLYRRPDRDVYVVIIGSSIPRVDWFVTRKAVNAVQYALVVAENREDWGIGVRVRVVG